MAIRKRIWATKCGERSAWIADYRSHDGNRHIKTFRRKKDAESWATTALFEVKQGTHTPESASITVAEAAENWIRRAELDSLERSTIAQYRQHANQHINPLIGRTKLSKLTTPAMQDVRDKLLEGMSRPLAKKVLTSIKSILSDAQRRGHVSQNVARGVSIKMDGRHRRKIVVGEDIPSKQEIREILDVAKGRWRPLLVTAVFTGLRASELRGLTWANVDFDAKMIRVRQRADKWNQIGSPKSGAGERDVPMAPMMMNTLREWKLECPKGELNLVFPNGRGNVEALANIYSRGFAPIQRACDIVDANGKAKYGMHALRHFCASWLIEQGFPPKRVQVIMGHSGIQMTFDTYGHLFPSAEDDHARLAMGELSVVGGD